MSEADVLFAWAFFSAADVCIINDFIYIVKYCESRCFCRFHSNMETELFMECEEEELEPWQQVDDSVEEDEMDYMDNYGQPGETNTYTETHRHTTFFI